MSLNFVLAASSQSNKLEGKISTRLVGSIS